MNKREKIVQEAFINDEEAVIRRLKKVYEQSLKDINKNAQDLQRQIEGLDSLYDSIEDEAEKKRLKSMQQSKVYQKQYQDAMRTQISGILDTMQVEEFKTVSEYLNKCYEQGFLGTMYNLQGQGIPLIFPMDQEAIVRAVQLDSKISKGLYNRLGEDVSLLKRKITATISRGVSTGMRFEQMAQQLSGYTKIGYNNAVRIARTEGHRIQIQSTMDACYKAKEKGADIVKQWDSTLDGKTRDSHRSVDGEIRELDEKFSNNLLYPADPKGRASEVINCRCALLQRARWNLDSEFTKMDNFTGELKQFENNEAYKEFKKDYFLKENVQYMKYVERMEEKYNTKNFNKVLSQMTDEEYKHFKKLEKSRPTFEGMYKGQNVVKIKATDFEGFKKEYLNTAKEIEEVKDFNALGRQQVHGSWEQYRQKFLGHAVPVTEENINDEWHNTIFLPTGKPKLCNQMLEALENVNSKYYSPLNKVIPMDKMESRLSNAFASTRHYWEVGGCEIRYNPLKFSDKGIERLKELSKKGYMPKIKDGDEIKYIVTHECGHSIINICEKLPSKSRNFVQTNFEPYKKARKELEKLFEDYTENIKNKKDIYESFSKPLDSRLIFEGIPPTSEEVEKAKKLRQEYEKSIISKYSLSNIEEFVAEGFADAEIGVKPNEYSLKVRDIIFKYFGKEN